ncbi:MAG: PorT family protein [Chitinophagaceae bacterium]|nr:PorT family protein [Chitinophagaceae bacterium]
MKKLIFLLGAFGMAAFVNAQTGIHRSANPGGAYLKGGLNLANISVNNNGTVDNANMLTSFHIGIAGDISLGDVLSFQPGLLVTGKGSKTEIYLNSNQSDNYYKLKTNPIYLEVPANLVFKVPMSGDTRFFFGAGPYAAVGIGGKTTGERKVAGLTTTYSQDIQFNNDDPFTAGQEDASVNKLRRFDYGLNALAGFEAGKFLIGVNYGYGLAKIGSAQNNNSDDTNKHRVWSLSLGLKL